MIPPHEPQGRLPVINDETPVKMSMKALLSIILAVAAAAASWAAIKSDVNSLHRDVSEGAVKVQRLTEQFSNFETDSRAFRQTMSQDSYKQNLMLQQINMKQDWLTGANRGPRPAASPTP